MFPEQIALDARKCFLFPLVILYPFHSLNNLFLFHPIQKVAHLLIFRMIRAWDRMKRDHPFLHVILTSSLMMRLREREREKMRMKSDKMKDEKCPFYGWMIVDSSLLYKMDRKWRWTGEENMKDAMFCVGKDSFTVFLFCLSTDQSIWVVEEKDP